MKLPLIGKQRKYHNICLVCFFSKHLVVLINAVLNAMHFSIVWGRFRHEYIGPTSCEQAFIMEYIN